VEDAKAREAQAAHDLAVRGHLLRLWVLPGAGRALGLYQARDIAQMEAILELLPLARWMTAETTPLSPHPSDPAIIYPPATAPTQLVATTGRPWCIASLHTSPHGSRNRGVGIEGSSASSAAA